MAPRIFAIINGASDSLFFASTSYVEAKRMYQQIPEIFQDGFILMRYDPNQLWDDNHEFTTKKKGKTKWR